MTPGPGARFLAPAAIVAGALCIRISGIAARPFHTDEAVNAFILGDLLSGKGYEYRTHDHHGPTLFHLVALPMRLSGVTDVAGMEAWMPRAVTAVCGAALVAGVFLLRDTLGRGATLAAAALLALAAPFVYYSGSFIHETPLMLLTLLFAAIFWRWRESGKPGSAALGGLLAGLMLATKETAAVMLLAILVSMLPGSPIKAGRRLAGIALGAGVAAAVTVLFFSDFLRRPERLADLIEAARLHAGRGLGKEHAHPWHTYWGWSGGVGGAWCAGLIAFGAAYGAWLGRAVPFVRACALWALLLFIFHSALPYKTPWLMLSFLLPLTLVSGYGIAGALAAIPRRSLAAGLTLLAAGLLFSETFTKCFREPVSPANPLAYSPSGPDAERLAHDLTARLAATPGGPATAVRVVARDYWPLPWSLRKLPRVGFQNEPSGDVFTEPALVVCGPESVGEYAGLAPFDSYEIRPGIRVFLAAHTTPQPLPQAP